MRPGLLILFAPVLACAQTAGEIKAKVAENQDRAEAARAAYVCNQEFDDNLWFPVSYGGELKLRALFLYARTISLSLTNSAFSGLM